MKKLITLSILGILGASAHAYDFKTGTISALDLGYSYIQTTFDGDAAELIYSHINLPEKQQGSNTVYKATETLQCFKITNQGITKYNCKINIDNKGNYTGF